MLVMTEVGDRLKRIRRRAMLTQDQLAKKSGVGITPNPPKGLCICAVGLPTPGIEHGPEG